MDNRIGSSPGSIPQPEITPENQIDSTKSTPTGSGGSSIQPDALPNEQSTKGTGSELKSELNVSGDLIKATLNQQLSQKADHKAAPNLPPGSDNVHISKAPGELGRLGLYEVNINGSKLYYTKEQLEKMEFNLGGGNEELMDSGGTHEKPPIDIDNRKRLIDGG
ncbi:MAG TPA: hypothetical protein VFG11_03640, partial [Acidobacteriota bacterium]|nr:hypothetical protein [Acidobacteriota bacterium]